MRIFSREFFAKPHLSEGNDALTLWIHQFQLPCHGSDSVWTSPWKLFRKLARHPFRCHYFTLTTSSLVHTYAIVSSMLDLIKFSMARLASSSRRLLPCLALMGGPFVCMVRILAYFHYSTLTLLRYGLSSCKRGTLVGGSGFSGLCGDEACDDEMPSWLT